MSEISKNALEQNNKKILVSELTSRFGLARSSVYDKLKKLSIRPFTGVDRKKYITLDELELLEKLDTFLKEKRGDTKDFVQLCVEKLKIIPSEDATSIEEPEPQVAEAIALAQSIFRQAMASVSEQQLTLIEEEQTEISPESSQQIVIEQLQIQKGLQTQAQDIQEVQERARNRAFTKIVVEELLVAVYEATENFTPEQKQQLEKHRANCKQLRTSRGAADNVNDFLSQTLCGLTVSPNFNSSPSTSPSGASNNV